MTKRKIRTLGLIYMNIKILVKEGYPLNLRCLTLFISKYINDMRICDNPTMITERQLAEHIQSKSKDERKK